MTRVASIIACVVLLGGCATAPTLDPSHARATGATSVAAPDLRPAPTGTVRWRSESGLLAGCEFDVVTGPSTCAGATSATRTADVETAHWAMTPDGGVALVAVDSHPDRTRSVFEPPLLLAPPTLTLGEPVTVHSAMRAVLIANPSVERDRGDGTRTVRYVGNETITIDGAPREAQVVEVEFVADLRNAKAERRSRLWVVAGDGIVAEEWTETLTILKVFTKRSKQTAMRVGVELPPRESDRTGASGSEASGFDAPANSGGTSTEHGPDTPPHATNTDPR